MHPWGRGDMAEPVAVWREVGGKEGGRRGEKGWEGGRREVRGGREVVRGWR